jgi:hypothetical protein
MDTDTGILSNIKVKTLNFFHPIFRHRISNGHFIGPDDGKTKRRKIQN